MWCVLTLKYTLNVFLTSLTNSQTFPLAVSICSQIQIITTQHAPHHPTLPQQSHQPTNTKHQTPHTTYHVSGPPQIPKPLNHHLNLIHNKHSLSFLPSLSSFPPSLILLSHSTNYYHYSSTTTTITAQYAIPSLHPTLARSKCPADS